MNLSIYSKLELFICAMVILVIASFTGLFAYEVYSHVTAPTCRPGQILVRSASFIPQFGCVTLI